jgi:flavin reductase (DIM6/NTAB) family NADH-FMN oxidoreductase RutF
MDPRELRLVFGLFTTGVTVVTAINPGPEPVGVTANSVTSVSLDPPLLLWCLANKSSSLGAFSIAAPFAVHILEAQQADIALHCARSHQAKFEVDDWWRSHPTPPVIDGALARIECRVETLHPGGDHTIIVGRVIAMSSRNAQPLAFHASRFGKFSPQRDAVNVDVWSDPRDAWM